MNKFSKVKELLEKLNIFTEDEVSKRILMLDQYMQGILYWNKKLNITNITDEDDFIQNHYIDSLAPMYFECFLKAENIIDIGTGGGFPGVPLAIVFQDKKFTLVDSLNKRIMVIRELCNDIGIDNVVAIHGRAEDLGRDSLYREMYDIALSRAVTNLPVLVEFTLPFLKIHGNLLAHKGPKVYEELKSAERAIMLCSGKVKDIFKDENDKERKLYILNISKIKPISNKYPRKAGIPMKKPLN